MTDSKPNKPQLTRSECEADYQAEMSRIEFWEQEEGEKDD